MFLYRVTLTHKDVQAHREWDLIQSEVQGRNPSPMPPAQTVEAYVAVHPQFGPGPSATAAAIATRIRIGDPDCWEEYEPSVKQVQYLGTVFVEAQGEEDDA